MCKVSIIVPMYKTESYIAQCIQSCINQTLKDIEIILINDGSPDRCGQIAQYYKQKDSRIKLIDQPNSGVSVARNCGLSLANGEWVLFLDGDDWLEVDAAEKMLAIVESTPCDILITSFFSELKEKSIQDRFFVMPRGQFNSHNNIELIKNSIARTKIANNKAKANVGVPWAKLYNREYLKKNNCLFEPGLKRMQDMVFNCKAFYFSRQVLYVDIPVYHYRLQEDSATKRYTPDFDETAKAILQYLQIFIEENNLMKELEIYYSAKAVKLYVEIIKLKYIPNENHDSIIHKIIELHWLYNHSPYKNQFHINAGSVLNRKQKILNMLLTVQLIFPVYIICYISYLVKKRALYHRERNADVL